MILTDLKLFLQEVKICSLPELLTFEYARLRNDNHLSFPFLSDLIRSPKLNVSSLESCHFIFTLQLQSVKQAKKKQKLLAANLSQHAPQGSSLVATLFVSSSRPSYERFAPFSLAHMEEQCQNKERGSVVVKPVRVKEEELIWKELREDLQGPPSKAFEEKLAVC